MQHARHARVDPSVQSEIAAGIERYLDGRRAALQTPVPGLALARLTAPLTPTPHVYAPSLCVALRGEKHVDLGDRALVFGADRFFLAAIDVPAILSVGAASPERPFVGLQVRLDLDAARLLIAEMDASNFAPAAVGDPFVVTGRITPDLLGTIARFVKLLETPRDIPILGGMLHREMLYRLLVGPTGARLREIATLDSQSYQVAKAVRWLRENFIRKLRVDELAESAGMSTSTLYRHFHAVTTMTPIQFQKRLRLHEARRLMLAEDLDAGVAAQRVGYESAAHFNHDYRRLFGRPPRQDIAFVRAPRIIEESTYP